MPILAGNVARSQQQRAALGSSSGSGGLRPTLPYKFGNKNLCGSNLLRFKLLSLRWEERGQTLPHLARYTEWLLADLVPAPPKPGPLKPLPCWYLRDPVYTLRDSEFCVCSSCRFKYR